MRAERSRPPTPTPLRARATPQVERTLRDAEDSQAAVQNTEEFVEIQLDLLRNRVLRFELLLSISTFAVGCGALVTGIFGMNLMSHYEDHATVRAILGPKQRARALVSRDPPPFSAGLLLGHRHPHRRDCYRRPRRRGGRALSAARISPQGFLVTRGRGARRSSGAMTRGPRAELRFAGRAHSGTNLLEPRSWAPLPETIREMFNATVTDATRQSSVAGEFDSVLQNFQSEFKNRTQCV